MLECDHYTPRIYYALALIYTQWAVWPSFDPSCMDNVMLSSRVDISFKVRFHSHITDWSRYQEGNKILYILPLYCYIFFDGPNQLISVWLFLNVMQSFCSLYGKPVTSSSHVEPPYGVSLNIDRVWKTRDVTIYHPNMTKGGRLLYID